MRQEPGRAIFASRPLTRGVLALLAIGWISGAGPALGQTQIRMPSPDPSAPPTVVAPPPTVADAGTAPSGSTMTPFGPAPAAGAAPTLPPGGYAPPAAAPGPGWAGSAAPGGLSYGTPPVATLNGNVQPPPPNWDPYAPPGAAPAAVLPQDPYYTPQQC